MSKNCDDLISFAHYNELSLLLGYEELKRLTKPIPEFNLEHFLHIDLEKIYMFCAENCIENPYIANYLMKRKQIEDDENTNEREERYCKKHKYLETKLLQEILDDCAENLNFLGHTCGL